MAAAPRLARAVAEITQPYGPFLEGEALSTLQEYLSDFTSVDLVYDAVLARASAEPISFAVIDKCIALLKRCLPRYAPSPAMLARIELFCIQASAGLSAASPMMHRSLLYLQTLIARQEGNKAASSSDSSLHSVSLPAKHSHSASDGGLKFDPGEVSPFLRTSGGITPATRTKSSPAAAGGRLSRIAAGSSATRQQRLTNHADGEAGLRAHMLQLAVDAVASPDTSFMATPSQADRHPGWALVPDVLAARWASGAAASTSGAQRLPPLLPPLVSPGPTGQQARSSGSMEEAARAAEHIRAIAAVQRAQAAQAGPAANAAGEAAKSRQRDHRPRLLFQYRAYSEQEALDLAPGLTAAALDAVCSPAGEVNCWGAGEDVWGRGGLAGSGGRLGPMCAVIVAKLVLDLWLHAGPAAAWPLALAALQRPLASQRPSERARAFDLLYNLSLHGELLYPAAASRSAAQSDQAEADGPAAPDSNGTQAADQASEKTQPAQAGRGLPGCWPQPHSADARMGSLRHWLRLLLFQLLQQVSQSGEESEEVWAAALGCLLHLATHQGHFVRAHVDGLPPAALAALLQAALRFRWSEQVYCHLVRLAANLLYQPDASEDDQTAALGQPGTIGAPTWRDSLRLNTSRLRQFGGVGEVTAHYRRAASSEARDNLLAVLLDHELQQLQPTGAEQGEGAGEQALRQLVSTGVADVVQPAFQCRLPGLAHGLATWLADQQVDSEQQQAAGPVLKRLELLAEASAGSLPGGVGKAVAHTLAVVDGRVRGAGGGRDLEPVWLALADLLCSPSAAAQEVGKAWLFELLAAAAARRLAGLEEEEAARRGGEEAGGAAPLLPHPGEAAAALRGFQGIPDQPQLAHLLRYVLSQASPQVNTATCFVEVVQRLLLYIRCLCQGPSVPPSTGTANRDEAVQQEANGEDARDPHEAQPDGSVQAPAASEEDTQSQSAGPADSLADSAKEAEEDLPSSPGAPSSRAGAGAGPGSQVGDWWRRENATALVLATLSLAVEWLLEASPTGRHEAFLQAASELLALLCVPAGPDGAGSGRAGAVDHSTLRVEIPASPSSDRHPRPWHSPAASASTLALAAAPCSPTWQFLSGTTGVAQAGLEAVSPVLLVRLFQQLTSHLAAAETMAGHGPPFGGVDVVRDARAAVLLLLVARCAADAIAAQQAGGGALWAGLLGDSDARVRYHAALHARAYLLAQRPDNHRRALRHLTRHAQQLNDEKLLSNPYLALSTMLELRLIDL